MLRKDFIMVQIEELGKVIAQMIFNRNEGAPRKNQELIQVVYDDLKIDPEQLMRLEPEELCAVLDQEDGAGLQRLEIAAKTLLEERFLHPEKEVEMRHRALDLLQFVQQKDTTFSMERAALIQELV